MDIPAWLDPVDCQFPDPELALTEPDGLLAIGGSLRPEILIGAYMQGIFPWYSDDQPILWWSPNPRAVLFPEHLHISRSLKKSLKNSNYMVTYDHAFMKVIHACARSRNDKINQSNTGTWLTHEMIEAYRRLHMLGYAHSVEIWQSNELVGGLYGLAIDRIFFGESMFHDRRDMSKIALVHLAHQLSKWGFHLIDCQQNTQHLLSLGAVTMPRAKFKALLNKYCVNPSPCAPWTKD